MAQPLTLTSSEERTMPSLRVAALAGIAVPVVFIGTIALLTWVQYDFMTGIGWSLTEEYEAEVPYPSGLAGGPHGWAQSANFAVVGVLALAFLLGLRTQFHRRRAGLVATVFLGVFVLAAPLNAVPTALPGEPQGLGHLLHFIGFLMTVLGGLVGTFSAGLALRGNPAWRGWRTYSVLVAPAIVLLAVAAPVSSTIDSSLGLAVLFTWFGVMGLHLYQVAGTGPEPAPTR